MERKDWLLLIIKQADIRGLTPGQLQKSLFLFGKGAEKDKGIQPYKFVIHHYGPVAKEIYSDTEYLHTCGLVDILGFPGPSYGTYSLTLDGLEKADQLEKEIAPETKEYLMWCVRYAKYAI